MDGLHIDIPTVSLYDSLTQDPDLLILPSNCPFPPALLNLDRHIREP